MKVAVVAAPGTDKTDVDEFLRVLYEKRPETVVFSDGHSAAYGGTGFDLLPAKQKDSWVIEVQKNRGGSGPKILDEPSFADKPSCEIFLHLRMLDLVDRIVVWQDSTATFDPVMLECAVANKKPLHVYTPSHPFRQPA